MCIVGKNLKQKMKIILIGLSFVFMLSFTLETYQFLFGKNSGKDKKRK